MPGLTLGQARAPVPSLRAAFPDSTARWAAALAVLLAAGAAYVAVSMPGYYRAALAVAIALNLIVLATKWPRAAVIVLFLFMPFLGLVRRLLIAESGWTPNDPLLLISPAVAIFLLFRLYGADRRPWPRDLLGRLVMALLALTLVQAFNPLGVGGILASLGGLIFLAVPLLWFFIGRELMEERHIGLLSAAMLVLALIVGIYGMWQTELAPSEVLPSWDQSWYEIAGYEALGVSEEANNKIRPFSTFPSNGEYATYLSIGLIFGLALVLHGRFLAILAVPILAIACFYAGGRAVIALTLLAAVVLAGLRTRNAALALLVIVVGMGATFAVISAAGPRLDRAAGLSGGITERNVGGLVDPLDPSRSTFIAHWDNLVAGIADGFKNPVGTGTGSTNLATDNLSEDASRETDNDVADVFVSLGALGGVMFLVIIFLSFRAAFSRYLRKGGWQAFGVAGLLLVTLGNWLNGGHYTLAAITWLVIGWASRPRDRLGEEDAPVPGPLPRPKLAARS
jgi:hypothetical protein